MRLLPLLCVALLAAGCYNSRFGERGDDATPEPVTATIRQLREKFAGTTFPVTGDIVVSGRVTTSDYDENFYRTFCIEEDGAGIEVMAGSRPTCTTISRRAAGSRSGSGLQLSLPGYSGRTVQAFHLIPFYLFRAFDE